MRILIGTSGFSYDDWRGTFYDPKLPKNKMLEAYAEVFTALELNVTYYRTPSARTARSIVERADGRLSFAIKAPGDTTHRGRLDRETIEPFQYFLEPFVESGTLAAILFQFPSSFQRNNNTEGFIDRAREIYSGAPMVVELRNPTWDSVEVDEALAERGISRAALDQPRVHGVSERERVAVTGPVAYFRFHGRNAEDWYVAEDSHARYRYRYCREELEPWVPRIQRASEKARTTMAFFNNHPDGNAPKDAEALAGMLNAPLRGGGYKDLFS